MIKKDLDLKGVTVTQESYMYYVDFEYKLNKHSEAVTIDRFPFKTRQQVADYLKECGVKWFIFNRVFGPNYQVGVRSWETVFITDYDTEDFTLWEDDEHVDDEINIEREINFVIEKFGGQTE